MPESLHAILQEDRKKIPSLNPDVPCFLSFILLSVIYRCKAAPGATAPSESVALQMLSVSGSISKITICTCPIPLVWLSVQKGSPDEHQGRRGIHCRRAKLDLYGEDALSSTALRHQTEDTQNSGTVNSHAISLQSAHECNLERQE